MRQNGTVVVVLCGAAIVVAAFLALRTYGGKSEAPPDSRPKPLPVASATPSPDAPPAPPPERVGDAKAAPASPGLVGLPAPDVKSKTYPVDEKYDARHDVMTYTVTNLKTDDARFTLLSARWMQAGQTPEVVPTSLHLTLSTKGEAPKLGDSDELTLVADGKPVIPATTKYQVTTSAGSVLEYVSFTLTTQDFLDFANAKTEARLKVRAFDLRIGKEERLALLSLASHFPRAAKPK